MALGWVMGRSMSLGCTPVALPRGWSRASLVLRKEMERQRVVWQLVMEWLSVGCTHIRIRTLLVRHTRQPTADVLQRHLAQQGVAVLEVQPGRFGRQSRELLAEELRC